MSDAHDYPFDLDALKKAVEKEIEALKQTVFGEGALRRETTIMMHIFDLQHAISNYLQETIGLSEEQSDKFAEQITDDLEEELTYTLNKPLEDVFAYPSGVEAFKETLRKIFANDLSVMSDIYLRIKDAHTGPVKASQERKGKMAQEGNIVYHHLASIIEGHLEEGFPQLGRDRREEAGLFARNVASDLYNELAKRHGPVDEPISERSIEDMKGSDLDELLRKLKIPQQSGGRSLGSGDADKKGPPRSNKPPTGEDARGTPSDDE